MISLLLQRGFPSDLGWLAGGERARAEAMRHPLRRDDFLLGRWTVKRALSAVLGCAADSRVEVRAAASGSPEAYLDGAPAPVSVSISHRARLALAAVAPAGTLLGADLELIEERSPAFVRDFFTGEEARWCTSALRANLIWSAKESALKALGEGLRADTRSVQVRLGAERPGPWQPLAVEGAVALDGFWCVSGDHVVTVVASDRELPRWLPG